MRAAALQIESEGREQFLVNLLYVLRAALGGEPYTAGTPDARDAARDAYERRRYDAEERSLRAEWEQDDDA